jgi:hypothetical protein
LWLAILESGHISNLEEFKLIGSLCNKPPIWRAITKAVADQNIITDPQKLFEFGMEIDNDIAWEAIFAKIREIKGVPELIREIHY